MQFWLFERESAHSQLQAAEEKAALDRRLAEKTAAAAKLREEGNRIAVRGFVATSFPHGITFAPSTSLFFIL